MVKAFNNISELKNLSKEELIALSCESLKKQTEAEKKYEALLLQHEALLLRQETLEAQIVFLQNQLFGKKSEKRKKDELPDGQLRLFDFPTEEEPPDDNENALENDDNDEDEKDTVEVKSFTRRKGRKALPDDLPVKEVVLEPSDDDKACLCGADKECIGEVVTERLEYVPQKIFKLVIKRKKYVCKECEGTSEEGISPAVITAPAPKFLIPGGIATSSLVAQVFVSKYVDAIPFYRQEKQFSRFGDLVSRQSMSNWAMKAAFSCKPLYERLKDYIRSGPLINMDETSVQVLKEPDRMPSSKSYMWVMIGGPPDKKVVVYEYAPTRSGSVARELLGDYSDCIQTDDYTLVENARPISSCS
jgi:transposase